MLNCPYPACDRLRLVPTGPGGTRTLPPGPVTRYLNWRWFPDGRRILLEARSGADTGVWIQDVGGGDPVRVPGIASIGAISPDGAHVVALGADGRRRLVPLGGGAPRALDGLRNDDQFIAFAADGQSLFVQRLGRGPRQALERYDLTTGRREPWRWIAAPDPVGDTNVRLRSVIRDGRAYLYTCTQILSELYLAELPWR